MERAIFYLEKELSVFIDENYPLLKFYSQLDKFTEHNKEQERRQKEMNSSTRSIGR